MNTFCKWQFSFVILDCMISDKVRHSLSFFKNEKHLNMMLLKIEDDLIVVDLKKMTQKQHSINSV